MPRRRFPMLDRASWRLYPHPMARHVTFSDRRAWAVHVDARRRWAYS